MKHYTVSVDFLKGGTNSTKYKSLSEARKAFNKAKRDERAEYADLIEFETGKGQKQISAWSLPL